MSVTTAIDTNVVIALWDEDTSISLAAETALENAFRRGRLIVSAPVFAELIAAPNAPQNFDELARTRVTIVVLEQFRAVHPELRFVPS